MTRKKSSVFEIIIGISAIVACIAAVLVVPEFRQWVGLDPKLSSEITPTKTVSALPADVQPTTQTLTPSVNDTPIAIFKGFPIPNDASGIEDINGSVNFQSKMSLNDAVEFYRRNFSSQGLTENQADTFIANDSFSLVFDNHPSGKSAVVQGVNLEDGTININIRLEDL